VTDSAEELRDFDFDLPPELIAQEPAPVRSDARLLIVRRNPRAGAARFEDLWVKDLPKFLDSETSLQKSRWFRNRSKVFPARLYARRPSGSRHEIVLIEPLENSSSRWQAILRNSRRFTYPEILEVESPAGSYAIEVPEEGIVDLRLLGERPLETLSQFGEMPLPPYIQNRDPARDRERYQSLWAQDRHLGSSAAPTASLHFDEPTIGELKKRISFYDLVLHVGLGTFEALRQEKVADNRLHSEKWTLPQKSAEALLNSRPPARVAIGTTALRCMESFLQFQKNRIPEVFVEPLSNGDFTGRTSIFIRPGYEFLACDALFTNFHLPRSSLFILQSAFAGSVTLAREAYRHAISKKYRFFSYGDASLWI
jgi:S-adenosylmethionine:tRNA ribosyltransferase-isomerase